MNEFFNKALKKAELFIEDQQLISNLLDMAFDKLGQFTGRLYGIQDQLLGLLRMLSAWVKREYTDVSPKSIVAMLAAVIYFINPIDLISDFLPFIGFADDITVITYVVTIFNEEIEKYMTWEKGQTAK